MQDADGWFRLGETASRENYVYTGQFLTLSTTGDAVKSGVITDYDGDKRRAAARIPNTTPGQNSHFTISASANQDDGPRGFLVCHARIHLMSRVIGGNEHNIISN
mmetsp:Transcript_59233/g.157303  ORF Transcript_59233/g.157303 Transcript_59233/m.157303 type:complete len:105 (+) Transcript_59233:7059-7373(+)